MLDFQLSTISDQLVFLSTVAVTPEIKPAALQTWLQTQIKDIFDSKQSNTYLDTYVQGLCTIQEADDFESQSNWLSAVEHIALAANGVDRLQSLNLQVQDLGTWLEITRHILHAQLNRCQSQLGELSHLWLHAGQAQKAIDRYHDPNLLPWNHVRPGIHQGLNRLPDEKAQLVLHVWFSGTLHQDDAEQLKQWVNQPGPWQDTYRTYLQKISKALIVTRWNPKWLLNIVTDSAPDQPTDQTTLELLHLDPYSAPLLQVPLPHLDEQSRLEVHLHTAGTWWNLPGPNSTSQVVPFGTQVHQWGDVTTGKMITQISEESPNKLMDAWKAVCSLRQIAQGVVHPRALDVVIAVAEDLQHGTFYDNIVIAHQLFEQGNDENDDTSRWVTYALEVRIHLEAVARMLNHGKLFNGLALADQSLRQYGSATMIIDEKTYDELTFDVELDPEEWWGYREAIT